MFKKNNVRKYIRDYKRLIRKKFHGAAGYAETELDECSDMEIAARFLSVSDYPITVSIENEGGKRHCYVTID